MHGEKQGKSVSARLLRTLAGSGKPTCAFVPRAQEAPLLIWRILLPEEL